LDATAILDRLHSLGIRVTVSGDRLRLEPGSMVPLELVEELKAHKQDIVPVLRGYRLKYDGPQASTKELEEIETRVASEGYILLWSHTLRDLVAFYKSEADRERIPSGFVAYSDQELRELFGERKTPLSEHSLRLIHEAKKRGGRVVDNEAIQ